MNFKTLFVGALLMTSTAALAHDKAGKFGSHCEDLQGKGKICYEGEAGLAETDLQILRDNTELKDDDGRPKNIIATIPDHGSFLKTERFPNLENNINETTLRALMNSHACDVEEGERGGPGACVVYARKDGVYNMLVLGVEHKNGTTFFFTQNRAHGHGLISAQAIGGRLQAEADGKYFLFSKAQGSNALSETSQRAALDAWNGSRRAN